MLSKAALVYDVGQDWQITTIEVDEPKAREVIVQWKASGLCHSDEHIVIGDMVPPREAWPRSLNPRADIPKLLDMYREGHLKLDELVTKTDCLAEINEGGRAMRDGENIRGVIVHD